MEPNCSEIIPPIAGTGINLFAFRKGAEREIADQILEAMFTMDMRMRELEELLATHPDLAALDTARRATARFLRYVTAGLDPE